MEASDHSSCGEFAERTGSTRELQQSIESTARTSVTISVASSFTKDFFQLSLMRNDLAAGIPPDPYGTSHILRWDIPSRSHPGLYRSHERPHHRR